MLNSFWRSIVDTKFSVLATVTYCAMTIFKDWKIMVLLRCHWSSRNNILIIIYKYINILYLYKSTRINFFFFSPPHPKNKFLLWSIFFPLQVFQWGYILSGQFPGQYPCTSPLGQSWVVAELPHRCHFAWSGEQEDRCSQKSFISERGSLHSLTRLKDQRRLASKCPGQFQPLSLYSR